MKFIYVMFEPEAEIKTGVIKVFYDLNLMILFFLSGSESNRKELSDKQNRKALKEYCRMIKAKPFLVIDRYMDLLLGDGFFRILEMKGGNKTKKYGYIVM